MRIVGALVVHEFRARWRGWAVLVLLVAFAGGAVLATAAGARRTSSAYPRYLRASHASDLLVLGIAVFGQLAVSRWSWQLSGNGLGIPADSHVPVALVLVIVPAVLIIANAVALWPGRSAARTRPAGALRTE